MRMSFLVGALRRRGHGACAATCRYCASHATATSLGGELRCCIASAFQPTVCTLRWFSSSDSPCQSSTALVVRREEEQEEQEVLSVFATGALPQSSPLLRWEFVDRGAPHGSTSGRDTAGKVSDDRCAASS
jgi:hypothetical protein